MYPQRKFVLVGDSGQQDPEIYGLFARKYPRQVIAVFIHDVTGEPAESPRYQTAFEMVPAERWRLFTFTSKR